MPDGGLNNLTPQQIMQLLQFVASQNNQQPQQQPTNWLNAPGDGADSSPNPGVDTGAAASNPGNTSGGWGWGSLSGIGSPGYGIGTAGKIGAGILGGVLGAPGLATALDTGVAATQANADLNAVGAPSLSIGDVLSGALNSASFGRLGTSIANAQTNAALTSANALQASAPTTSAIDLGISTGSGMGSSGVGLGGPGGWGSDSGAGASLGAGGTAGGSGSVGPGGDVGGAVGAGVGYAQGGIVKGPIPFAPWKDNMLKPVQSGEAILPRGLTNMLGQRNIMNMINRYRQTGANPIGRSVMLGNPGVQHILGR